MNPFGKDNMKEIWVGSDMSLRMGEYASKLSETLKIFDKTDPATRIWRKDPTFWIPNKNEAKDTPELINRLGWLDAPHRMMNEAKDLSSFASQVKNKGFQKTVLLGMGGSSLAPEVLRESFEIKTGYPELIVLDSTNPDQIREVEKDLELKNTLFIVSSKSGTTLETISLFEYFYHMVSLKAEDAGKHFIAITDPGSNLEKTAKEKGFLKIFHGDDETGGRYSALTNFGMVPAALMGIEIESLLAKGKEMAERTKENYSPKDNPGVVLGTAIAELAAAGRNKLTFVISNPLSSFGLWVEQLIAESTGKKGKGILPVVYEDLQTPQYYGNDRVFVSIGLKRGDDSNEGKLNNIENAGHPVIRIYLEDKNDIGGEFYRWEMATAVAGKILGINPFDQPNVEHSKKKAKELIDRYTSTGELPDPDVQISKDGIDISSTVKLKSKDADRAMEEYLDQAEEGDYVAIMAFVPYSSDAFDQLNRLRSRIHKKTRLATTVGFGPRFLHSTGQLHKGDNNRGFFLQLTAECDEDVSIPGREYSFKTILNAQSKGDYLALKERERRIIRLHFSKGAGSAADKIKDYLQ